MEEGEDMLINMQIDTGASDVNPTQISEYVANNKKAPNVLNSKNFKDS